MQKFKRVILHALPGEQGWHIVGVTQNGKQEVIAIVDQVAGEWLAERWADLAAKNLAGQQSAEVD